MEPVALLSAAVDLPAMVRSLASLGTSAVDLLFAVRLHTGCTLREARALLAQVAPEVREAEFQP